MAEPDPIIQSRRDVRPLFICSVYSESIIARSRPRTAVGVSTAVRQGGVAIPEFALEDKPETGRTPEAFEQPGDVTLQLLWLLAGSGFEFNIKNLCFICRNLATLDARYPGNWLARQ